MTRLMILAILATVVGLYFFPMLATTQRETSQNEAQNDAARKFRAYLEQDWKHWMEEYPVLATFVGYPGQTGRRSDDAPAGIEARSKRVDQSPTTRRAT